MWYASAHTLDVLEGLLAIGFELVQQVIWDKGLFAMSGSWYNWAHEPCVVVRKPGATVPFYGARNQATIWRAPSPKMIMAGSTEAKQDHPTQKPVVLFETPITNHLRAGEAVYDPFCGSGTTLIAAERLGRRCYAMEIDPRYVQVAIERWQGFSGQTPRVASHGAPSDPRPSPRRGTCRPPLADRAAHAPGAARSGHPPRSRGTRGPQPGRDLGTPSPSPHDRGRAQLGGARRSGHARGRPSGRRGPARRGHADRARALDPVWIGNPDSITPRRGSTRG